MYPSPKISLMSLFMAGSSNLHPAPDLQLKAAGPLISPVKKSEISGIPCEIRHIRLAAYIAILTNATVFTADKPAWDT
jgi:hypothetical protein